MFFHATPRAAFSELVHGCDLMAGIILSAGDGAALFEFLKRRRPCFGICLTPEHSEALQAWLERCVFEHMQAQGPGMRCRLKEGTLG